MGAGLLQMAVSGDTFKETVADPASYFSQRYVARSNYAVETKEVGFDRQATFGMRNTAVIPRLGDLLGPVVLKVRMTKDNTGYPECNRGTFYPVESLCRNTVVTIGQQVLDVHTSDWYRVYDSLHRTAEESLQYQRLSNFDGATIISSNRYTETLYLPLVFAFCRSPAWYIPLVCLPTQELRITFDFRTAGEVGVLPDGFQASLLVDYVYLSEAERLQYLTRPQHYRYECLQQTGMLVDPPSTTTTTSVTVPVGFTGDVKSMYFVVKNLDPPYAPVRVVQPDGSLRYDSPYPHGRYFGDSAGTLLSLQANQFSPSGLGLLQPISEKLAPVLGARLLFNGAERASASPAAYFNKITPLRHCQRCPLPGIYMFSFVFDPMALSPTGTALFDQVEVQLQLTLKRSVDSFIYNDQFDFDNAERCASFTENCRDLIVFGLGYRNLDFYMDYAICSA